MRFSPELYLSLFWCSTISHSKSHRRIKLLCQPAAATTLFSGDIEKIKSAPAKSHSIDVSLMLHRSVQAYRNALYSVSELAHARCHQDPLTGTVTFPDGSVRFQEVWLEIDLKQIPCDSFYRVINWQHMDTFAIFHIWASLDAATEENSS